MRTISIVESAVSSLGLKLGRALRLRCPRCGGPGTWPSWLKMAPRCATCGLAFDRGEADHWLMPLLFFPFSRTIWLAFDLHFRPVEPGDVSNDGREA